jgi:hypothetical protein
VQPRVDGHGSHVELAGGRDAEASTHGVTELRHAVEVDGLRVQLEGNSRRRALGEGARAKLGRRARFVDHHRRIAVHDLCGGHGAGRIDGRRRNGVLPDLASQKPEGHVPGDGAIRLHVGRDLAGEAEAARRRGGGKLVDVDVARVDGEPCRLVIAHRNVAQHLERGFAQLTVDGELDVGEGPVGLDMGADGLFDGRRRPQSADVSRVGLRDVDHGDHALADHRAVRRVLYAGGDALPVRTRVEVLLRIRRHADVRPE